VPAFQAAPRVTSFTSSIEPLTVWLDIVYWKSSPFTRIALVFASWPVTGVSRCTTCVVRLDVGPSISGKL